jgi:hypothetical protein
MMSAPEGEGRLAEILREILDLCGTKPPNHSKSTGAKDSPSSFDVDSADQIQGTCGPRAKETSEEHSSADS